MIAHSYAKNVLNLANHVINLKHETHHLSITQIITDTCFREYFAKKTIYIGKPEKLQLFIY